MISRLDNTNIITGVVIENEVDNVQIHKRLNYLKSMALFPSGVTFDDLFDTYEKGLKICLEKNKLTNHDFFEALNSLSGVSQDSISYLSYCSESILEHVNTTDTFLF